MAYRVLIETSNPADIALVKSLLDSEDVLYFVQGEAFSAVRPMVEPVRFMVAEDRLEDARELIGGLGLSCGPITSATEREAAEEPSDD